MKSWSDKYLLNIPEIDEQHKMFFEIIDKCYDLLLDNISVDKYNRIHDILNDLKEYSEHHFKAEEEYMLSIKCKKFLSHKISHNNFIDHISEFNNIDIDSDQEKFIRDLLDFIMKWAKEHILLEDKDMLIK